MMTKDLTSSHVSRQNILNNGYALEKVELNLALGGTSWRDESVFTKTQVADILAIDVRTIERYIEQHNEELSKNGYRVIKGQELKEFKDYVADIDVGDIRKIPSLGVFSFRAVLNIAIKDKVRDTMYSEALKAIASFEHGISEGIKNES